MFQGGTYALFQPHYFVVVCVDKYSDELCPWTEKMRRFITSELEPIICPNDFERGRKLAFNHGDESFYSL